MISAITIHKDFFEEIENLSVEQSGLLLKGLLHEVTKTDDITVSILLRLISGQNERFSERQRERVNKRWEKNKPSDENTMEEIKTPHGKNKIPYGKNGNTENTSVTESVTESVKKHIVGQSPTACAAARLNESQKPDDFIKAAAVDKAERKADIERIVAHLNKTIGTRFSPTSKDTAKHINARLNEGFKLDDFITVIDKKAAEWVGTDRAQYLRPETLFGTKFEGYLNAPFLNIEPKGENYGKHSSGGVTENGRATKGFEHLRSLEI